MPEEVETIPLKSPDSVIPLKSPEKRERRTVTRIRRLTPVSLAEKEIEELEVPVVPGEPCCNKVCEDLNEEIENREIATEQTRVVVSRGFVAEVPYPTPTFDVEVLKDLRTDLKRKNICKCSRKPIEHMEIPLFVVPGPSEEEILEKMTRPVKGLITFSPRIARTLYNRDKPKIPTGDSCCAGTCKVLNTNIGKLEKWLNEIELRSKDRPMALIRSADYGPNIYKSHMLKQYRHNLKRKGICECIE